MYFYLLLLHLYPVTEVLESLGILWRVHALLYFSYQKFMILSQLSAINQFVYVVIYFNALKKNQNFLYFNTYILFPNKEKKKDKLDNKDYY